MTLPGFQQRVVRDLQWCVYGIPVMDLRADHLQTLPPDWLPGLVPDALAYLQQLDLQPEALLNAVAAPRDRRLGHYYESLLAFWFAQAPGLEIHARNLPLHDGQRTLGEFDFLLRDVSSGELIHLEVAAKFYLGFGDLNQAADWWGPGLQDRLDRKLAHMLNHQTRLSLTETAQQWLGAQALQVDNRTTLLAGRMFYPVGEPDAAALFNPGHARGWWVHANRFADTAWPNASRFVYLPKSCWFAPLQGGDLANLRPFDLSQLVNLCVPQAVACVDSDGEISRGFVLPDSWWDQRPAW